MSRSRPRGSVLAGLVIALSVCDAALASGAPQASPSRPSPSQASLSQALPLQLEVYRNGQDTGLIAAFLRLPDGRFAAMASELRAVGLAVDGADTTLVVLEDLSGLDYRFDDADQLMFLQADGSRLATSRISLRTRGPVLPPSRDIGALLNYSVSGGGAWRDGRVEGEALSGDFEARAFGPFGMVSDSFAVTLADERLRGVRLDSYWTIGLPSRTETLRAGDLISGGFAWTRPLRLGGFQWRRDFATRPDIVSLPTPTLSMTAAAPSTLDVMLGPSVVYSEAVPAGPIRVSDLPVVQGQGQASLVLRDASGVAQAVSAAYFASPELLRAGLLDFSVEAGFARRRFGYASFDYNPSPVASASVRYGVNDKLTLQAHAEGGAGVAQMGAGVVVDLAGRAIASFAAAGSTDAGQMGELLAASVESRAGPVILSGQAQRTFGPYRDLAAVTAPAPWTWHGVPAGLAAPHTLLQGVASTSLGLGRFGPGSPAMVSIAYARVESWRTPTRSTLTASLHQQVGERLSVQASLYASRSQTLDRGAFVSLSLALGRRTTASSGVEVTDSRVGGYAEVRRGDTPDVGSSGWRLRLDQQGSDTVLTGEGVYRSPVGRLAAVAMVGNGGVQLEGRMDGALVWLGGPMAAPSRLDGPFAVADVGAPGLVVRLQNRPVGVSDANGRWLIADLNPFEANLVSIDAEKAPLDLTVPRTRMEVSPPYGAGAIVRFGLTPAPAQAMVSLRLEDGEPAPVGARASLNGGPFDVVVGYDGVAFVEGALAANDLVVDLGGGQSCHAAFALPAGAHGVAQIAAGVCRMKAAA